MTCRLCDGTCRERDLDDLVTRDLAWLWDQLARTGDRRGDPSLVDGMATITVPDDVASRAAAAGLLGRRHLGAGQRVRVDLAILAERIAPLTPGGVAAHSTGRRLAQRVARAAARARREADLRRRVAGLLPEAATDAAWAALRRGGWVTRILSTDDGDLVDQATRVIGRLPPPGHPPVDRRVLAQETVANPHALDSSRPLPGLVLALLAVTGRLAPGTTARDAWITLGVRHDDIVGGLTLVGISPAGWTIPHRVPVTVPPRVLADCRWPVGAADVFVTENPSVLSAAVDIPNGAPIICTTGTPSAVEVAAIARLADAGWRLHVRADFDDAGIRHMNAILAAAEAARPWRMSTSDYLSGLARNHRTVRLRLDRLGDTPWDPTLARTMAEHGIAVYEESLLHTLLSDLRG